MGSLVISDQILIDVYLCSKIADKYVGGNCIHDADMNSDHPYDLVHKHTPGKGVYWFFSPERYIHGDGNSKVRAPCGSWYRARSIFGVDDKKKGKKKMVKGSTSGYLKRLTYHEVASLGSVIKPGWLMTEYAIEEEHDGGAMILCKVYRSPRGPRSEVSSSRRKRKACIVVEEEQPVEQTQWLMKRMNKEDMILACNLVQPSEFSIEELLMGSSFSMPGGCSSMAIPAVSVDDQTTGKTDDECQPPNQEEQLMPPCAPQTENEDDVMAISFEELRGASSFSSSSPCTAQPNSALHVQPENVGGEIEFTLEELMGS